MKFGGYLKSTHVALFVSGVILVAVLVLAEKFFGLISKANTLFSDLPVDPTLSLLAVMGAATVIMISLFSVMISKWMKMKIKV